MAIVNRVEIKEIKGFANDSMSGRKKIRNHYLSLFSPFFLLIIICIFNNNQAYAQSSEAPSIMIMAEPSLALPMSEIARDYSRTKKITVNTSFVASKEHAQLIEEGAPADIFITSSPTWIAELKLKGLIDVYSQAQVARNQLALIGPADSMLSFEMAPAFPLSSTLQQGDQNLIFLIPEASTTAESTYVLDALEKLKLTNDVKPYGYNYKDSYTFQRMIRQHGAYGLAFYTDALYATDMRIVSILSEQYHLPINYQAVVVAGENMTPAREFMGYLKSEAAKNVFARFGFSQ